MRAIDADALQKAVTDLAPHPHDRWETIGVWHIIEHMPTLTLDDLRPKGRWVNNKDDYPECDQCGYMPQYDPMIDDIYCSPFCPSCGADMRGGGGDA